MARLVALAAAGESQVSIALQLGCSRRTVQRQLACPDVQERLAEFVAGAMPELAAQLRSHVNRAVVTLVELATDPGTPPATRVRAAVGLIDAAARYDEAAPLSRRVEAIEAQLRPKGADSANTR